MGTVDTRDITDSSEAGEPPVWASWHARSVSCSVLPGVACQLVVGGRRMWLKSAGEDLYVSPQEWMVSDAFACDLDGDGCDELVLLVWKVGSYGPSRPFWIEADETTYSQHVFVLGSTGKGSVAPRWMSSKLGVEVGRMLLSKDGLLELSDRNGGLTRWRYGSWGFELIGSTSTEGVAAASMLVTGDNIAHSLVFESSWRPQERVFDFAPIYQHVCDYVGAADVAVVGQETPLVAEPALRSGYPRFATPSAMGDALAGAGFDVVLAASNHVNDIGPRGLEDTLSFWETSYPDMRVVGLRRATEGDTTPLEVVASGDLRIALFNYTYGLNGFELPADSAFEVDVLDEEDVSRLVELLGRAREEADFSACMLHCGEEYQSDPTPAQRELAERLIDAGAGLVVYAHSHVLSSYQGLCTAQGAQGVVYWGLGNFVAVQDDLSCALGGMARVTFERDPKTRRVAIRDHELVPTVCHVSRGGEVRAMLLSDYTNELASSHYLNDLGQPVSVEGLWDLYAANTAPRL